MTLNELQREVMHLGFETQIEDTEALISATSLALGLLYTDRPVKKRLELAVCPITPLSRVEKISLSGGEEVTLPLSGLAFALEVSGSGRVVTFDGKMKKETELDTEHSLLRGRLFTEGEITLYAKGQLTVFNLVCYRESLDEKDIPPFSVTRSISLCDAAEDFAAALALPRDSSGREIPGAAIIGDTLTLPSDFFGTLSLPYRARPPKREEIARGEELAADPEAEHLLPLLTASFLWLDDDDEKARYYMSLYRDAQSTMRRYGTHAAAAEYKTVDGWA
ncbi:MAG: hypothetical protein IKA64_00525 [Clostridia bacterium]|nr:hypothetical protein [Clostridia bacterium]